MIWQKWDAFCMLQHTRHGRIARTASNCCPRFDDSQATQRFRLGPHHHSAVCGAECGQVMAAMCMPGSRLLCTLSCLQLLCELSAAQ